MGRSLRHQRCSRVINGMDGKVQERAHALRRQPTMTFVAIAIRTRSLLLFPMVERHEDRTNVDVSETFRQGLDAPLVRSVGHDAVGEREPIVAATKDRHPMVVEKNLGTGFFPRRRKETSPKSRDMTRWGFEIPWSGLWRSGLLFC
ncbi:hypothetical protein NPIL_137711 [Nephila pilipes]|uniref:Uncharacterized protein n=1 Tax=Nephila pilipes TaxID=299642 RepID=A0A8X6N2U7_NEPPI|nr:hypothetical protein NPIL_137711 [Nephila pilipes]